MITQLVRNSRQYLDTAMIGHRGRYFDINCADRPVVVMTIIAAALHLSDAFTAEMAIAVVLSVGGGVFRLSSINML